MWPETEGFGGKGCFGDTNNCSDVRVTARTLIGAGGEFGSQQSGTIGRRQILRRNPGQILAATIRSCATPRSSGRQQLDPNNPVSCFPVRHRLCSSGPSAASASAFHGASGMPSKEGNRCVRPATHRC